MLDKEIFDCEDIRDKAIMAAAYLHQGQKRKYSGEPYIHHPMRVASMVLQYGGDETQYIAAILHDTVEDCDVDIGFIAKHFGINVAAMVDELTNKSKNSIDPETGKMPNRATRKKMDREKCAKISDRSKLIKLCDRLDNVRSMPKDADFTKKYFKETKELLDEALTGVNKDIEELIRTVIKDGD